MHGLLIPKVVNVSELNRHDLSCGFDPKSTYGAKKKNSERWEIFLGFGFA